MSNSKKLCPSARCRVDSTLLGVVEKDGHVSFLRDRIKVNEEFVQISSKGRRPEKRFRFADVCAQDGCEQWTDKKCGIINELIDLLGHKVASTSLNDCTIRDECR